MQPDDTIMAEIFIKDIGTTSNHITSVLEIALIHFAGGFP